MKTVWILALNGLMDSSLAITLDLLRAAQAMEIRSKKGVASFQFKTVGVRTRIETAYGLTLRTDLKVAQIQDGAEVPAWVVVPALGAYGTGLDECLARPDAAKAQVLLRSLHLKGSRIAGACSAVFLIANAGLLAERGATTAWWMAEDFRERYPTVRLHERRMVVRDGALLTAGSAFAQLDLMLALITDLVGTTVADLCARYLLVDRRPAQARYMIASHLSSHDPAVVAAERWIDDHLAEPISVRMLAKALAMGERTLARRVQAAVGMSPVKLIQQRRLMLATHMIETSTTGIEAIAGKVGYKDSTTLRRLIRRDLGTSPSGLRRL